MKLIKRLRAMLAVLAVIVAPSAGSVLAAPAAPTVLEPAGVAGWRAGPRNPPDPRTADPRTVRDWFAATPAAAQHELAAAHPGVVGNLDGAPAELRYEANRRSMLAAGIDRPDGDFLLFDSRGRGRVAQVFGDLTTARRIVVLVPGMTNRLYNFWRGVGGRPHRSPSVQAADLYRAVSGTGPAVRSAGSGGFAVIAWLGYDTPQGFDEAGRAGLARTGATELIEFVDGLVTLRPEATIALLGHSYGSTVIGHAASRLSPRVTDIAVFGSPGMGVDTVSGLGTGARVWAGQSTGDWIRWSPSVPLLGIGHGTRPVDREFGARRFPTTGVLDHDHYLSPGTGSLTELARIAGTPPETRAAPATPARTAGSLR